MATKLGHQNCWCKLRMMMMMMMMMKTFMEVKGQQRSNVANYALWLPNLVRRIADASLRWWWPSGKSKVNKCQYCKLHYMATKPGQKNRWCKFRMMMMTFMAVKGQQRSNVVNYALWLPNLVRRIADASLRRWWPLWKSKVNRGHSSIVQTKIPVFLEVIFLLI